MPISVAILGAGIFARIAHLPAIVKLKDTYQLKAVYSRSEASSTELARTAESLLGLPQATLPVYHDEGGQNASLDSLLARDDIQGVIVVLPITLQPTIVLKALAAGKHVISEKPVAPTVESGIALIQNYEANYKAKGLIWRVAENFEAEPGLRVAAKAIADQKIGKVCFWNLQLLANIDEDSMWYKTPWRTVPDYQGGFLLDAGVHFCAELRVLLPSPLKQLTGFASLNRKHLAPHDTIHALIRSDDGSHGVLELSFGLPSSTGGAHLCRITGTEGTIKLDSIDKKNEETGKNEGYLRIEITNNKTGQTDVIMERKCGVEKELESFEACVNGKDDGLGSPWGALLDVALIEAGLNSNGTVIDLQKLLSPTS